MMLHIKSKDNFADIDFISKESYTHEGKKRARKDLTDLHTQPE